MCNITVTLCCCIVQWSTLILKYNNSESQYDIINNIVSVNFLTRITVIFQIRTWSSRAYTKLTKLLTATGSLRIYSTSYCTLCCIIFTNPHTRDVCSVLMVRYNKCIVNGASVQTIYVTIYTKLLYTLDTI